jgi:hypothetical protein
MDYLLNQHPLPPGTDPVKFLTDQGAVLRARGFFDFDKDGQAERWITLRHRPLEKLELWIIAPAKEGIKGLFAGNLETDAPQLSYLDDTNVPPVVLLGGGKPFMLLRDPDTAEPYLYYPELPQFYPNRFQLAVEDLGMRLLSGENPETILAGLLALPSGSSLPCRVSWTCDMYYYYLGLAYELAGNKIEAAATYKLLWDNYSKSPFTTLARLKLVPSLATPTPAPTETPTVTPTPPPTPTFPATPTTVLLPTPTAGPSPTPTLTFTPFPTNTPYP